MRSFLTLLACCLATPALAERPLTYREVLESAVAHNPTVGRADLARQQAQYAVRGASGVYDPMLNIGGNYRRSQQRGFFQGFPFKSNSTSYLQNLRREFLRHHRRALVQGVGMADRNDIPALLRNEETELARRWRMI